MTYAGDSSIAARVQAVQAQYRARLTRVFLTFALVEGPVLLILVIAIYGFGVIDPDIGVWLLMGVALIGGVLMSTLLVRHTQAQAHAVAQAQGENPLF